MKKNGWQLRNKLNYAISLLFIACMTATAFIFDHSAGLICSFLCLGYIIFMTLYIILDKRGSISDNARKTIAAHTFDYLEKLNDPALLIDKEDRVAWFNDSYSHLYKDTIRLTDKCKMIDNGFVSLESLTKPDDESKFSGVHKNGRVYNIKQYPIETAANRFLLVVWNDVTELDKARTELTLANVLVAYIVVDNISEISQGVQDKYREVSAKISNTLSEWCQSLNGIIKEYERDKYIMFFEERRIDEQLANKFEILDKIADLSSDDPSGVPLTVSIGVARINGTLSEKENAAKLSLQLALQRGGAQCVVKTKNDNEIYGGKTKTIEKITKIKSRIIASKLVSAINASGNILIMSHQNPDFDAVASSVGIARLVMFLGKKVNIVTDFESQSVIAARNLLANLPEYTDIFVDPIYGQDLLTPDTLLIITDASNPIVFESPEIYRNSMKTAIVDHHRQVTEFTKEPLISYIEPTSSSSSELVSEMLEFMLPPMTVYKEESELLMSGILLDTQNFTRNVGVRTFGAAVYLRSEGGNPGKAQALFKYKLDEFKKLAEFERNIMIFRSMFAISQYELDNDEENRVVAARVSDRMLQIDGIKASFALALVGETIHISARSDGSVNVSLILEKLKGGGHYDSAGAKLTGVSMKQSLVMLREAIVNYCEQS